MFKAQSLGIPVSKRDLVTKKLIASSKKRKLKKKSEKPNKKFRQLIFDAEKKCE